jgi:quinol monooxygenase YgiN
MDEMQSIARFKIHDGKLEDWKRLAAEAMETVRSRDSGTLQYDLFLSDDSSRCGDREVSRLRCCT